MERPKFFPIIRRIISQAKRTYSQTQRIEVNYDSTSIRPRTPDQIQMEDYNDRWRTPEMHGGEPNPHKLRKQRS